MEAFKEIRFPEDISYGSSGGPQYSTDVVTVTSGFEQRNINWHNARCKYNVAHGVKTKEQLDNLINFFRLMKGRAFGFRFKDWTDFEAKNQFIAIGNDTDKTFQLFKTYNVGSLKETRVIKKLVHSSVKVYLDGRIYENVRCDYNNGILYFKEPVGSGIKISASFEFDVPVRFDTDSFSAVIEAYENYSWNEISLVEIRI
ncbi:MAG: DUF2460 domain-containing protein [Alphaproteobacteria bacterium]